MKRSEKLFGIEGMGGRLLADIGIGVVDSEFVIRPWLFREYADAQKQRSPGEKIVEVRLSWKTARKPKVAP